MKPDVLAIETRARSRRPPADDPSGLLTLERPSARASCRNPIARPIDSISRNLLTWTTCNLTRRSLKKLVNQAKEEIALITARHPTPMK